jgi:hypothetical protein
MRRVYPPTGLTLGGFIDEGEGDEARRGTNPRVIDARIYANEGEILLEKEKHGFSFLSDKGAKVY